MVRRILMAAALAGSLPQKIRATSNSQGLPHRPQPMIPMRSALTAVAAEAFDPGPLPLQAERKGNAMLRSPLCFPARATGFQR